MPDETDKESYRGLAKARAASEQIQWGSPLAVLGVFVEVVRARFQPPNRLPWQWRVDPRRLEEDNGSAEHPFPIYIESELLDDPDARDFMPAIYVGNDDIRESRIVVGDKYAHHLPTRDQWYHAHEQIPVTLTCVSPTRAEASILGDIVYRHIQAGRNLIREEFDLHAIDNIVHGKTQPFRRNGSDTDKWMAPVTFVVTMNVRWHVQPFAPVLQGIRLHLTAGGVDNATQRAIDIALKHEPR